MASGLNNMKRLWITLVCALFAVVAPVRAEANAAAEAEVAYTRTLAQRVAKIVAVLGIDDSAKSNRVHSIIDQHYRDMRGIHDERDSAIKGAKSPSGASKESIAASTKAAQDAARAKLDPLHGKFLTKLSAELSSEQVEKVKDGMTYGVMPLTYGVYLKMYPELNEEQKAKIKGWLVEARESAMDGSTSNEKHAVFGKYKGRINNYLSKEGFDAKKGQENLKKVTSVDAKPK